MLSKTVNGIQSRNDLVDFLHDLVIDLRKNPQGWENSKLESYLEAMAAWLNDSDGHYIGKNLPVPEQPSWKMIGEMLLASKSYE